MSVYMMVVNGQQVGNATDDYRKIVDECLLVAHWAYKEELTASFAIEDVTEGQLIPIAHTDDRGVQLKQIVWNTVEL